MALDKDSKIYVAGHNGMVGSAVVRALQARGFENLVTRSSAELDLINQERVAKFFEKEKPDCVFMCAARVGGIYANMNSHAEFLYENTMMELNTIRSAMKNGTKDYLFIGSVCVYPCAAEQPVREDSLLTGPFEPMDEGYGVAKLVGLEYCDFLNKQYGLHYISVMPTNLYGPRDNYNPKNSHVLPGMIQRFDAAKNNGDKEVVVWGDGTATREFLYVDDLADACLFLMENYSGPGTVSVGTGVETSIRELAYIVKDVVGFEGEIVFDASKPEGTHKRYLDVTRLNQLGWKYSTSVRHGVELAYADYLKGNVRMNRGIERGM